MLLPDREANGPILLVVTDEAAVQGVFAAMLIFRDVVGIAVEGEGPILDSEIL